MEVKQKIIHAIDHLSEEQQKELLAFLNSLLEKKEGSISKLLELAGSIDKAELDKMEQSIQEDCEQINYHEW